MKKYLSILIALSIMLCLGMIGAAAENAAFYAVTYHINYGSSTSTEIVTKEPGKSITIDRCSWSWQSSIFVGWATSPEATEAEYFPGDVYKKDADLNLYAVWTDAYQLGEISLGSSYQIPAFPVSDSHVYIEFTVAETGYYRLKTTGKSLKGAEWTTTPYINVYDTRYNSWSSVTSGETIRDKDYSTIDLTVTAMLEAGKRYQLSFICGPNPINLAVDNGFSSITYHINYGSSTSMKVMTKEPGKSTEIEGCSWGWQGSIFVGWATDPEATEAEYFPGDVYNKDADLDLYAVWTDAYQLGEISLGSSYQIPAFPVSDSHVYIEFTVAETGYYRLKTTDKSLKGAEWTTTPYINVYDTRYNSWSSVASGETIRDKDYSTIDLTVTAMLEAGKRYQLSFICGPNPINLLADGNFFYIEYNINFGSSTSTEIQTIEPGESAEIERCSWGWQSSIFAGWATDPEATEAEYFPGDICKANSNLKLYAVWDDAYELGMFTGPETCLIPAFPVSDSHVYIEFSVSETGIYRLYTDKKSLKGAEWSTTPYINVYDTRYNSWSSLASGETIRDKDYSTIDCTITAKLEPGKRYQLFFICGPNPITLVCQPQYEIDPYSAAITLPADLKVVRGMTFTDGSFESVYIPENVETVEANAFYNCPDISKVVIASPDVKIDENAFGDNSDILIVAPLESTGQAFAESMGFEFRRLGD